MWFLLTTSSQRVLIRMKLLPILMILYIGVMDKNLRGAGIYREACGE